MFSRVFTTYVFIPELFNTLHNQKAGSIPNLIGVILFGSALTGDVSKKSDIDLLLITQSDHNPELGEESFTAHRITSEISKKYDLEHTFSLTFYNLSNDKDIEPDFLWEVCKDGKPRTGLAFVYQYANISNSQSYSFC